MLRRAEIAFASLTAEAVEAKNHSPLRAAKALDLSRKMRQVPVEHTRLYLYRTAVQEELLKSSAKDWTPAFLSCANSSCMTRVDMTSLTFVAEALVMAEPFHVHHEVSPFHVSILEW
jgi:hypothetical protein